MKYAVMVGPDDETATPVHQIGGGLQTFTDHAKACDAAKDLVRMGLTREGAFVVALKVTAFYLPIPVGRVQEAPTVAIPDETLIPGGVALAGDPDKEDN